MKIREFMNTYSRYGKVDIPNICEQCGNLNIERFIKLNERKEENKMEQCIKIIIRKDEQYNTKEGRVKYGLEIVSNQDTVIFTDYFILSDNNVLVNLSDAIATIFDVYSFEEYVDLLKSYGITHKIEKMLSEEEIREHYEKTVAINYPRYKTSENYVKGYIHALEYVLGIDNE